MLIKIPRSLRIIFICGLITLSGLSHSIIDPIILNDSSTQTSLSNNAFYLEDITGEYSLSDIVILDESNFELLSEEILNKGFTSSTYWLIFSLLDKTIDKKTQSWKLETTYPLLDYLDIYIVDKNKNIEHIKLGDIYPYSQRPIDHRNFIVPISFDDNERKYIYVRISTSSSMQVPIFIWHPDYFFEAHSTEQYGLGLYYGMMLVMFFYNFFLWCSIRDPNYLWYIGYLAAFTILQATINGLSYQYLWPNSPWIESIAPPMSIALVGFFGTAFTRRFLNTRQYHVVADNLLRSVLVLSVIVFLLSFIADTATFMAFAILVTVAFLLCILYASVAMFLRGHRQARFFLAAWVSLILGGLFTTGMVLGIFPNNFLMTHASKIGSVIEIILLSFALADRIKVIENEKKIIEFRAQQALELTNKNLKENNRLKDEFLATISHEFRTPLNGILGSLELTQPEITQKTINMAKGSANEMLNLVDQVLSLTELQAGNFIVKVAAINLPDFLEKIDKNMQQACAEKDIKFSIDNNTHNPETIMVDEKRLLQAINPILDNAVRFTDRGHISLSVQIKYVDKQYLLLIKIEDSGIGIAEHKRTDILNAFTQGDGSSSRQFSGLGIGLSLVQVLCTQLQGSIHVSSEVNNGTLIELSLPIDVPQIISSSDTQETLGDKIIKEDARVLIVEDNHINQVVLKTMLQRLNIKNDTADHGRKALSILQQANAHGEGFDLILMDCQMPVMDGFEATQSIRNSGEPYANIPIIAVTANALSSDREHCLKAGMNDYLSKPFQLNEIRSKLQDWLAH
jgi:signal transduction histidine kinase/ActR/RegA family two-component response regulator